MCGIAGIVGTKSDKVSVSNMVRAMSRRGPDDSGVYLNEKQNCCLGHARLSIIDLTANGHQPMHILDNRFSIVFNGEIYNYKEIKRELEKQNINFTTESDTEVILWGWFVWNEEIVEKLRGMFAFCIRDQYLNKTYLVRDRLGIKPLVYHASNGNIVFASSLSAIRASGIVDSKINRQGFFDLLTIGAVAQPRTIIEDIYTVPPGTIITIEDDLRFSIKKYWNFSTVENMSSSPDFLDYDSIVIKTRSMLEEACKYHLVADVPVGSFLSGGVDSTVITALMAKNATQKIKSFTIGFENESYLKNELSEAAIAAEFIGTEHTEVTLSSHDIIGSFDDFIEAIDQPSFDGLNTYWVSKVAKDHVKVALSGLGADEIFAGYDSFLMFKDANHHKANLLEKTLAQLYPYISNRYTFKSSFNNSDFFERLSYFRRIMQISEIKKALFAKYGFEYENDHFTKISLNLDTIADDQVLRFSKYEINGYLLNMLLRDADALSMSQSLEVRPVFLDHKLVEFALAIPSELKLKNGITKSVLKDATKDLLPDNFFNRKKSGFTLPITTWIGTSLRSRIIDVFTSNYSFEYFNKEYLLNLVKNIEDRRLSNQIWIIFIFLSWVDKFHCGLKS